MIALYFRLIGARIRSQMQYKLSFWLDMIGFGLITGLEFSVIAILLSRFPSVAGWSIAEIGLLYGLSSIAFALAEMIARGFDSPFERMMQSGSFDTLLIRPIGTFFQVLATEFQLRRLGRLFQGAAVLTFAFSQLPIVWDFATIVLIVLTIFSGTLIFCGLMVFGATICFWTIKTPEVINAFTAGGQQMSSYPQSIYNRWIRAVFMFIIPVAFTSYPTALVLLGRTDPHGLPSQVAWAGPLVASLFLALAIRFWNLGVSKYTSTGS